MSSSSSSTNFIATQVLNKTSGPLCVTYYTTAVISMLLLPSQGRLPAGRSNRRQTTSQVAPLAASQASSDIQDGGADVQDDVLLNASIFERPDPDSCSSSSSAVIRRPAADRPKTRTEFARRSFSVTLETHYHPTLDPAVLWTPSNDTPRPIFSDSLNLTPPAPLYFRTLWRYTNAVIVIIITVADRPSLRCRICTDAVDGQLRPHTQLLSIVI